MDNSRIYLKGKEIVTPFYLDEAKKEVVNYIESNKDLKAALDSKYVFFLPKVAFADWGSSENIEFVKERVEHIAITHGWENIVFIMVGAHRTANGIFTFKDKANETTYRYEKLGGTDDFVKHTDSYDAIVDDGQCLKIEVSTDTLELVNITGESLSTAQRGSFLGTSYDYPVPYVPKYAGSPATKKYVDDTVSAAIGNISTFSLLPVDSLPTEDIQTNIIYAVPSEDPKEKDVRIEYVYLNDDWEAIGTTKIDLSNYYTKAEIDAKFEELSTMLNLATSEDIQNILNGTDTLETTE